MFKKILIANRGEIAVRIVRACRELGIQTVAVYSSVDRSGLYVKLADEAYFLGGPQPKESYLDMEKIIEIAKSSGAQAIHPGYGFLAENPKFVKLCEKNRIKFIGPDSLTMERVGNKPLARRVVEKAGVPIIPGSKEPIKSNKEARDLARRLGLPIMIKAAFGGGGRGMRRVNRLKELLSLLKVARLEARVSFDDSSLYIEKYIRNPRHIEVQILADEHGNIIHLGERDCTIQRRYQKLLEETPSPVVDKGLRDRLGEAAIRAARAVEYTNAGTVEFVLDERKNFYFIEVNARIQVEHSVTERVTGIDLVKSQIRLAAGERLPFSQRDVSIDGCAMECRINVEDPRKDFAPSPGTIGSLRFPGGLGVRVDSSIYPGYTVPLYYDTLIAKLTVWGKDREEVMGRMRAALDEFIIEGVKTTIPLHKAILCERDFQRGRVSLSFIERHRLLKRVRTNNRASEKIAVIAGCLLAHQKRKKASLKRKKRENLWRKGFAESKWQTRFRKI
jgi:acetyl-CoA carboxylase biotin carboxylase subunit